MSIYLVTYDLNSPGQNYQRLYDALKKFQYCKGLESVWFITSQHGAEEIRDHFKQYIDSNDKLFVTTIRNEPDFWASWNVNCADWLNNHSS